MITVAPYVVELEVTVKDREPYVARCNGSTASCTMGPNLAAESAAGKHFAKVCGQFDWQPADFTCTVSESAGCFPGKLLYNVVYTPKK